MTKKFIKTSLWHLLIVENFKLNDVNFTQWLGNLPLNLKRLLNYYGSDERNENELKNLSTTGRNEYILIRTSLYIHYALVTFESVEQIAKFLSVQAIKADTPAQINALNQNLKGLIDIRDKYRRVNDKADNQLLLFFLIHDLGKMRLFLSEEQILKNQEEAKAENHDEYLIRWMDKQKNYDLHDLNAHLGHDLNRWVDILDGLGQDPSKLLTNGYFGLLESVEDAMLLLNKLNEVAPQNESTNEIIAFNSFLHSKAMKWELRPKEKFDFLLASETRGLPWHQLSEEQQHIAVMLQVACPLIFAKAAKGAAALKSDDILVMTYHFCCLWEHEKHRKIVSEIVHFMVSNLFEDHYVFPYNVTGLMHKADNSHFVNGGTVQELFTVFYPFVLNVLKGRNTDFEPKLSPTDINKFQILQGLEASPKSLGILAKGAKNMEVSTQSFDLEPLRKQYLDTLKKSQSESSISSSYSFFPSVDESPRTSDAKSTMECKI